MKWKTRITEMLGIRYPIIQGAYAGFGTSKIAVPVSEAGGLGIITAGALKTPEALRKDIRRAKASTNKPIGVNLGVGICPQIDDKKHIRLSYARCAQTSRYFQKVEILSLTHPLAGADSWQVQPWFPT